MPKPPQQEASLQSQNGPQPDEISLDDIPVIDLQAYMNAEDTSAPHINSLCKQLADCLHNHGILIVKDPRAHQEDNSAFIDLMEQYFESRGQQMYALEAEGQKDIVLPDSRPQHHYLVGVVPQYQEVAREHTERINAYAPENKPMSPIVPVPDAKWRFHWKIGQRPEGSEDNYDQVLPTDFPDWTQKMDKWGNKMFDAIKVVAEMAALGMGAEKDCFTSKLEGGPHLLAPTGTDLVKNDVGTVLAGFHYDIAFLTIHGKSRYPGLYAWLRNGKKVQVKVPEGCLLLQAGKTFENLTGGYVLAGYHEVIYTEQTKAAFLKAQAQGKHPLWRVSSTMFTQFKIDTDCSPLPELSHLYSQEEAKKYPKMTQMDILMTELSATNMAASQ